MGRFELEPKLKEEIRARVLGEGFMKIVQTVRRNGKQFKIAMRPVEIGGEKKFQAEMTDDGQVQVKNLDMNAAAEGLEEIIAQRGARDMHLMTAKGDLHMRVTKKGHVMVTRSAEMDRVVTVQPHDRVKKLPLTSFDSAALLKTIGLADGSGKIRASMRGKYDQVNEFLKVVKETVQPTDEPFTVVDCGCGKAYLTISLYFYLTEVLKFPNVKVIGIDRRSDVVAAAKKMAAQLDVADRVLFVEADLNEFQISDLKSQIDGSVTSQSNSRTIEQSNCRTVEQSNNRTFEHSNIRTTSLWLFRFMRAIRRRTRRWRKASSGRRGIFFPRRVVSTSCKKSSERRGRSPRPTRERLTGCCGNRFCGSGCATS